MAAGFVILVGLKLAVGFHLISPENTQKMNRLLETSQARAAQDDNSAGQPVFNQNTDTAKSGDTKSEDAVKNTDKPAVIDLVGQGMSLEEEKRALERERKDLEVLASEVDRKIARLKDLQASMAALYKERDERARKREKHLIKIYTAMPPKKAAPLMDKLDMDLLVVLFRGMKSDEVGAIMPYLSPERAARVSELLQAPPGQS